MHHSESIGGMSKYVITVYASINIDEIFDVGS